MAPRNKPPTAWEIAKPILQRHYLDGTVTDAMKPKDVWQMQPEFSAVRYENFRNNFARLKRTTKEHKDRADLDEAWFRHDTAIYALAKDIDGYWDGSEAQRLLKEDIEQKRNERSKPADLWKSRPEYQNFGLTKF